MVYLNDEELEALRQLAAATPQRQFRSLGKGDCPGGPAPRWDPTDLYARRFSDSDHATGADTKRL